MGLSKSIAVLSYKSCGIQEDMTLTYTYTYCLLYKTYTKYNKDASGKSELHIYHVLLGNLHDCSPSYFIQLFRLGEHLIFGTNKTCHAVVAVLL